MALDIRTLLVAAALTYAFCAAARLLLWRMNPTIPGLSHWAFAGGAGFITLMLVLTFGKFHWQPALSLAQLFAVLGLVLSWDGFRRFINQPPLSIQTLTVISAVVIAWLTLVQIQHSTEIRALGNAVLITILSALIARELLNAPRINLSMARRATGWIYSLNAVFFLLRIFVAHQEPQSLNSLDPNGSAAFILLWQLCMAIGTTLGMILMTAERLQSVLDDQANRDPLTGALNRRSFSLLTDKAMAHSFRFNKPISVMIMDLDKFKRINDKLGHDTGDVMLCRFVTITEQVLRDEDIFCRYGGEEFVAVLPDTTAKLALVAAERVRTAFATDSTFMDISGKTRTFPITVSIGITEREQNEDFDSMLHRADTALYQAKNRGRNCCEIKQSAEENSPMTATE